MKTLLSIDPGLRNVAVAEWHDGELVHATLVANPNKGRGPSAWRDAASAVISELGSDVYTEAALEVPQVYRQGLQKGDPSDLIELAGVDGALTAFLSAQVTGYLPARWKGQVPKDIHHARILKKLTDSEKSAIICPQKSLLHNVYDAIGIGLFHLGR